MIHTTRIGRHYLTGQGLLMLGLGTALFVLGSIMANPAFEESGYVISVLLVALSLLINCIYHGFLASGVRTRLPITSYLLPCTLSIATGLIFWLINSASMEIGLLAILAGTQGLFWSLWYMRLALRLQANYKKAALLSILAGSTSFLGIILATQSHLSKVSSVTAVACYTAFIGAQVLLTSVYLFRECAADGVFQTVGPSALSSHQATQQSLVLITNLTATRSDEVHAQAS